LAKGGDYTIETIIGHNEVKNYNGEVVLVPFIDGYSTTDIIEKIKSI
jgi:D-beta-D-heptose 7-phosphate kinase/D-beta-D-heptose 1-phosphate adenosyltransferase